MMTKTNGEMYESKKVSSLLEKGVQINLNSESKEEILNSLPKLEPLQEYRQILQIGPGKHQPCIHNAIPEISERVSMKKSENGELVTFVCKSTIEAKNAVNKIEQTLGRFGYKARHNDNIVEFKASQYTSISRILHQIGLTPLYCKHHDAKEQIVFAAPEGLTKYDIKNNLEIKKEIFEKKFGYKMEIPTKVHSIIKSKIFLPNTKYYEPEFMEFIIDRLVVEGKNFTQNKIKTYETLYKMIEKKIPINLLNKKDLIDILHQHTKISDRTLEKYFIEGKDTIDEILRRDFYPDEPYEIVNISNVKPERKRGISVDIDNDNYAVLELIAKRKNISKRRIVNKCIEEYSSKLNTELFQKTMAVTGIAGNTISLMDNILNKFVIISAIDQTLLCGECNSHNCSHIGFCLNIDELYPFFSKNNIAQYVTGVKEWNFSKSINEEIEEAGKNIVFYDTKQNERYSVTVFDDEISCNLCNSLNTCHHIEEISSDKEKIEFLKNLGMNVIGFKDEK